MKYSFVYEGKRYISAKRASEISDYSSDYIGQLCRAEKLDCRRIGRSWFVTKESLQKHRDTVLQDEVVRNRVENLRGKKFAKLPEENISRSDSYSLSSTKEINEVVVKTIKVEEKDSTEKIVLTKPSTETTKSEKEEIASKQSEEPEVIKQSEAIENEKPVQDLPKKIIPKVTEAIPSPFFSKLVTEESQQSPTVPSLSWKLTFLSPEDKPRSSISKMTYLPDERPLLPTLSKRKSIPSPLHSPKVLRSWFSAKESNETKTSVDQKNTAQKKLDKKLNAIAKKSYNFKSDIAMLVLARSIILGRVLAKTMAILVIVGTGIFMVNYITSNAGRISTAVVSMAVSTTASAEASVYDAFHSARIFLQEKARDVIAFFTIRPIQLSLNGPSSDQPVTTSQETSNQPVNATESIAPMPQTNGVVVIPSSGMTEDQAMKQRIQNSFSDQVEVNPDKSGTTGVITPVFKDTKGQDFVYVMVPVKDKIENPVPAPSPVSHN